jgi:ADP-heptose:LPS heptosyltransferase
MVLVVRHCGLGDLLTALPAMRAIRRRYPGHRLVTTCPASLLGLARRLAIADAFITEPPVTRLDPTQHVSSDDGVVGRVLALKSRLRVVVALRVPVRADLMAGLVRMAPESLVAYRHAEVPGTEGFPQFSFEDHILVRWERLLHPSGIRTDPNDLYLVSGGTASGPWTGSTVIHVGSASQSRRWPAERWAAVAEAVTAVGHSVVVTGSEAERPLAETVARSAGLSPGRNLCGATDILELAAIIQHARLVLSTDTGISHLATAFRCRSVTLFGAVTPAQWGPPAGYELNISLWKGGHGEAYADLVDAGLLGISVSDVLEAVTQFDTISHPDREHSMDRPIWERSAR